MDEKNDDYYLRVECDNDSDTVAIIGNRKGLEYLKECIGSLLDSRRNTFPADISLMVPSWGGRGLSEVDEVSKNSTKIEHLRLYRWE